MTEREREQLLPTEAEEQAMLMQTCRLKANLQPKEYPGLGLIFHIPNGGKRNAREAKRFRAEGVKAGVPDLFLPVARGSFHGLWIEMKRRKGGRVQETQKEWVHALEEQGYAAAVAYGAEEAWEMIEGYYSLGEFKGGNEDA